MAVIIKKRKDQTTCDSLRPGYTFEDFLEAFKSLYPKDWEKLGNEYAKHERKTKPGKSHPMAEPVQFLKNALNVAPLRCEHGSAAASTVFKPQPHINTVPPDGPAASTVAHPPPSH